MKMQKSMVFVLVFLAVLILSAQPVRAAEYAVADGQTLNLATGELTWTEGGALIETYPLEEMDTIGIAPGAAATVTGERNVIIACGTGAVLTLDGVTANTSGTAGACALSFAGEGNTLNLIGTSNLTSGENVPGIRAEEGCTLEIKGEGSLVALGGLGGAGIGGGSQKNSGDIIISGGNVTAAGGIDAAGIGGGLEGSGGTIQISGGVVNATGGGLEGSGGAAGIGSGDAEEKTGIGGGNITITGGDVTATGARYAAGIGCGDSDAEGQEGATINISGGTIRATGGEDGAGIGGGYEGDGGEINISGGSIQSMGGNYGAGIGGGDDGDGGIIKIEGVAAVTATGGDYGAGIGGGDEGNGGDITIDGSVEVLSTGGYDAAGIGGGSEGGGSTTMISGGTVTATGGEYGAGIGSGDGWSILGISCGEITISGGDVTAVGGKYAAGIGSGDSDEGGQDGGTITISGGTVTATGGEEGAGIGGGYDGHGGEITISGGLVYAMKGYGGYCDIGKGNSEQGGTIGISGDAEVLLGTDGISPEPTATAHTHYTFTEKTPEVYGIPVPEEWEAPFGAYLILYDLEYNKNGGGGTLPPPVTDQAAGAQTTVADGSGLEYGKNVFAGWNTAEDGSGEPYAPGDTFTFEENTTLYAQWTFMYTLSYNAHGGRGDPPEDKTQEKGSATTVAENPFTKVKAEFTGWNTAEDGSGEPYGPWDEFIFEADTTLYAQWADMYTLSYSANGGSGEPPEEKTQIKGSETAVAENPFTKVKAEFTGWNTAEDGSGEPYGPWDEFIFEADTTLFAQWEDLYTLSYNANGGGGTPPAAVTKRADSTDKAVTVKNSGNLERPAYEFTGWNTKPDGRGETYEPGGTLNLDGNVTLFAQWDMPVVSLTLNSKSEKIKAGESTVLKATVEPEEASYSGIKWRTTDPSVATVDEDGIVKAVAAGATAIIADADRVYDVCVIVVSESGPQPTPTPTPTATPTPQPTEETTPRPTVTKALTPEGPPDASPGTGRQAPFTILITIRAADLPVGAAAVRLPDGNLIFLNGEDALTVEVESRYVGEDGSVPITVLDDEGVPLGVSVYETEGASNDAAGAWKYVLMWTLIILAGAGAAGFILWRSMRHR